MSSHAHLFQVVTFATDPRRGNPAFVLSGARDASDHVLATACAILRTDIVAVVGEPSGGDTPLRFFTTEGPHAGAGHATLAAAHIVLRDGLAAGKGAAARSITFHLTNGDSRAAHLEGDRICVDFPAMPGTRVDRIAEMEAALGARPLETWVAPFGYVAIFDDPAVIASMRPDMALVSAFDRSAVIATAPGGAVSDIVIRVFAPNAGLPEDPVCGTAHRIIVPYWAERTGKTKIHSRHLSPRGGDLWCEDPDLAHEIEGLLRIRRAFHIDPHKSRRIHPRRFRHQPADNVPGHRLINVQPHMRKLQTDVRIQMIRSNRIQNVVIELRAMSRFIDIGDILAQVVDADAHPRAIYILRDSHRIGNLGPGHEPAGNPLSNRRALRKTS